MPRLRKPPVKPEDMAPIEDEALPTEPVEIELTDEMPGETIVTEEVVEAAPQRQTEQPAEDDNPLSKALDAQRRAEELQRVAQRERDYAIRVARENARKHDEELARERSRSEDAEYNSVLTAIAAEQSALDKAEAEYVAALAASDFALAAKAQRVMAISGARIDRLEDNKQTFEQRRDAANATTTERREPVQPQPQAQDFEQRIAALPDVAKGWLRKHPEFMNDVGLNRKIQAAHAAIVDLDGVEAFSPAYFDALDSRFGFKAQPQRQEQPAAQPQRRSMPMSAPVTRDIPGSNGKRQSSTVTLTPEEVDIARKSIIDRPDMPKLTNAQKEYIYAQNKMKLKNKRASGEYRHTTEQTG